MHLVVPIVSFRNPQDIMRCLAALELSTYSDFEIIICENGGDDSFAELIRRLPTNLVAGQQIRAISRPDNPGYAVSFNACINASPSADAWWALNPDTQPSAGAMAAMVDRLRAGDDTGGGFAAQKALEWAEEFQALMVDPAPAEGGAE